MEMKLTLGTDSQARKDTPMLAGLFGYFLAALAGVARHSWRSNRKHNGDEPMHWARGKSMDHGECVLRHVADAEEMRAELERNGGIGRPDEIKAYLEECDALAWRALAYAQTAYETYGDAPLSFNSRVTPPKPAPFCKGTNCNATPANGYDHSPECVAEHDRATGLPVLDYSHEMPLPPLHGPAGADWRE
jgi:hypothetical protein